MFKINIPLFSFLFLWVCVYSHDREQAEKSRVIQFEYGGYDDTTCALISGKVYIAGRMDNRGKSRLTPLANVQIRVEQNNTLTTTDTKGNFIIGFSKGVFSLLITKTGYQSLRITNYISIPDQVSSLIAVLETGKERQTYIIPPSNKNSN